MGDHQVHNHGVGLDLPPGANLFRQLDSTNTLAVWLQRAGYHTAHLGKYINGYESVGRTRPQQIPPGWTDWNASVVTYNYLNTTLNENGTLVGYPGEYQTDVYAEKASDIVRRGAATGQPFFAWISFTAPHTGQPREPDDQSATPAVADRHRDAFSSEPLPDEPSFDETDRSDKPRFIQSLPPLSTEEEAAARELYQQQLEALLAVDEAIGRILDTLEGTGQADNTLVVFTSDNGFFHGQHEIPRGKNLFYEPATRVPLILRGPGIPAGVTRDQLVANIDLAPTFVQAAQATPDREFDGRSLLQLARNPKAAQGRPILLESTIDTRDNGAGENERIFGTAVRTPRFLYAEYDYEAGGREFELYDMQADPHQLDSRHDDPTYADTRAELAQLLASLRAS